MKHLFKIYLVFLLIISYQVLSQEPNTSPTQVQTPEQEQQQISKPTAEKEIEEVLVLGEKTNPDTIERETEQLISVAGAGLDPLQAIFTLPGVTENNDGEPVFRGSASADNLYYVDLVPVAYLFHIFGNSIIDKKVLRKFNLYPSAFPSKYSNATAGVLDIELRDPKRQPFSFSADASFLISGVFAESQVGENGAFYINYRRSLLDLFADQLLGDDQGMDGIRIQQFPTDFDYTGKYVHNLGSSNKMTLIFTGAEDELGIEFQEDSEPVLRDPDLEGAVAVEFGFGTQGLIWDYEPDGGDLSISNRFIKRTSSVQQTYGNAGQRVLVNFDSSIYRIDLVKTLSSVQKVAIGYNLDQQTSELDIVAKFSPCSEFNPDPSCYDSEIPLIQINRTLKNVNTSNFYIEHHYDLYQHTYITAGINYFENALTNQARSELRFKIETELPQNYLLEFRYGDYSQLPDLIQLDELVGNPDLENPYARHYNFSIYKQFRHNLSLRVEWYYKNLYNVVTSTENLDDAEEFTESPPYSNDATGISKGMEILLKKELSNKWFGWFAASINSAKRTHTITNQVIAFEFEKPLQFDLVLNYRPTNKRKRWEHSLAINYQSGSLYTPVTEIEYVGDCDSIDSCIEEEGAYFIPVYGSLNSYRYPANFRLDLKFEYISQRLNGSELHFYIDIYNATSQQIVQSYSFSPLNGRTNVAPGFGEDVPVETEQGFGIIPSLGFQIKF